MKYDLNGKVINIPDKEIENSMAKLGLSRDEAVEMWLEDEGYLENAEQTELEQKAKENRITATIHGAGGGKRQSKPRTVVISDEKQHLFKEIYQFIAENFENVEILKENKLISLKINEKTFKIDLIEQRKPKKQKWGGELPPPPKGK